MNNSVPMKVISMDDLMEAGCFNVKEAIRIIEDAFVKYANGDVIFPDKTSVVFDQKTQDRINCLPAGIVSEKVYGMKWVSVFPGNPVNFGKPNLTAVYLLSELTTGYPLALMEGSLCSNLRTASVGAIGAKYFARKNSEVIGFIGAGEQAKSHFLTMLQVLPGIKECRIASRTSASEQKFIEQMRRFHPEIRFVACCSDYRAAVETADVIITAISGQEKILQGEWIKEGAFYCHVAGVEDDFSVALKADKIVCDNWEVVKHRTQTISQMYQQGLLKDESIYANLDQVVVGNIAGRESESEFVYFNSVGMSYADIALAYWMYQKVAEKNLGNTVEMKRDSMFDYAQYREG